MDSKFVTVFESVAAKFELNVEVECVLPPIPGSDGNLCMRLDGASLCALVVPFRNEVEVWLEINFGEPDTFHAAMLSAVVGHQTGLMFNERNFPEILQSVATLLEHTIAHYLTDRDAFLIKLKAEYEDGISRGHERSLRSQANEAWNTGDRQNAAKLYRQLAEPTANERKKIELAARKLQP
jgi:hypothetical protein